MKIDMHCHTKEGSPDSLVSIEKTIDILIDKCYDGMVVTDHNSYTGYKRALEVNKKDFVIFKGIEYDTADAGHMIIILPENIDTDLFTHKGMRVKDVIQLVRSLGGILGPAHPFDYYRLGIFNNARWVKNQDIIKEFDFIETFNSCGSKIGNQKASMLAKAFNLPTLGGSDSHRIDSVGKGWTKLTNRVVTETELIKSIQSSSYESIEAGGEYFTGTTQERYKNIYAIGIRLFWLMGLIRYPFTRRKALQLALIMNLL